MSFVKKSRVCSRNSSIERAVSPTIVAFLMYGFIVFSSGCGELSADYAKHSPKSMKIYRYSFFWLLSDFAGHTLKKV